MNGSLMLAYFGETSQTTAHLGRLGPSGSSRFIDPTPRSAVLDCRELQSGFDWREEKNGYCQI